MSAILGIIHWIWNAPRRYVEHCIAEARAEDAAYEAMSDDEKRAHLADKWG